MGGQKKFHFLEGFWRFRVLGGLGAVLGLTVGRLGSSWGLFLASWPVLGLLFAILGPFFGLFAAFLVQI